MPELGLSERRREKQGRKSAVQLQPWGFLGCQEGVKEPKAGACGGGSGGRGGNHSLGCVREKFKLQFNFMSASTPLEWRGGK